MREALQTLPFFGSGKVVWLRDCNFLGDERAATASAVTETLNDLAGELKAFNWRASGCSSAPARWTSARSSTKPSTKSVRWKSWPAGPWTTAIGRSGPRPRRKPPSAPARRKFPEKRSGELVNRVGPNPRQLDNEVEKLCLYAGDRKKLEFADVAAVCIAEQDGPGLCAGRRPGRPRPAAHFRRLDEELWEVKLDSQKSEIGLLYGLISKVRAMLLLKEMLREGWIKPEMDYNRFKAQLEHVPADQLPADRRFNPLALNPYVLYKALPQAKKYSLSELVRAMDLLLRCNRRLVSSGLDEALVLQEALVQIVLPSAVAA